MKDLTRQGLKRNLAASKGLYLLQKYSTDVNQSRGCFSIKYASKHFLLFPLVIHGFYKNIVMDNFLSSFYILYN